MGRVVTPKLLDPATTRVSVVIPVFDGADFVAKAIESALTQTFSPLEVIVVNDGSRDAAALARALKPFGNQIVYLSQENRGVAAARNAAIQIARGDLLAFLDADDAWFPDFLASQVAMMSRGRYDMVYANALLSGDETFAGFTYMDTNPSSGTANLASLLALRCHPIASGVVVRKELVVAAGLFNPILRRGEDFDLWVRLARAGARIGYQREVLLDYCVRPDSLSRSIAHPVESDLNVFLHIRANHPLPLREAAVVDRQIQRLRGTLEIERGKASLADRRYREAREHFRSAATLVQSTKLWLVRVMALLTPALLRRVYVRLQAGPTLRKRLAAASRWK